MYQSFVLACMIAVVVTSKEISREKRQFDLDNNFQSSFIDQNFGSSKQGPYCNGPCKTSRDCCDGFKCKRFYPGNRFGYCAKKCTPVGPGKDCRRCQACTTGFTCTVLLSQHYVCLKRLKQEDHLEGKWE